MSSRTAHLFQKDTKARWAVIYGAAALMGLSGFVAEASSIPLSIALPCSVLLGAIFFAVRVIGYSRIQTPSSKVAALPDAITFSPWIRLLSVPLAATIIVLVSSSKLQAAVLNKRLSSILKSSSPSKAAEAAKVLQLAVDSRVKLRSSLASTAVAEISRNTNDWDSYVSSVEYTFNSRAYVNFGMPLGVVVGELDLDNFSATDSFFADTVVVYHGGPLLLSNVRFNNVKFRIADTPNGRLLAEAIQASNKGKISVTLH